MKFKKNILLFCILNVFIASIVLTACVSSKKNQEEEKVPTAQELIFDEKYEEAKEMFRYDQDPNLIDENGNTALHAAVIKCNADMVEFLTKLKDVEVDSTIRNNDGLRPINIAIQQKDWDSVKILLAYQNGLFLTDLQDKSVVELVADKEADAKLSSILITKELGNITDSHNQNMVHYFVKASNLDAVKSAIAAQLPLSIKNDENLTPLDIAYSRIKETPSEDDGDKKSNTQKEIDNVKIIAQLLLAKCEPTKGEFRYFEDAVNTRKPNLRGKDNKSALHYAALYNHIGILKYLIDQKADLSIKDDNGLTPLHDAVAAGNYEIARILLESGANPNLKDSLGRTALLMPMQIEKVDDFYTLLLKNKADAKVSDNFGNTTLHIASANGTSREILSKLKNGGADINARNEDGDTPLFYAVEHSYEYQAEYYISEGADIYAQNKKHESPITKAIDKMNKESDIELLQKLVTKANINTRDSNGNTPLHLAIMRNSTIECLNYFINLNADLDARNYAGDSILHTIVKKNNQKAGETLISKGANVYATNAEGYSPLRTALERGGNLRSWFCSPQVIHSADGNGNTPLHYAAEWKYNDSIKYLISQGADINKKNTAGQTPIFNAIKADSSSTLKLLVDNKADYSARDLQGNTILHYCVNSNAIECTKVMFEIVSKKASQAQFTSFVNSKNLSGKTALAYAASKNYDEIAALLIENNADVNACDITGKSIISDAVTADGEPAQKVIDILARSKNLNVNLQDMYGRSAYHEAAELKNPLVISRLAGCGGNALIRDNNGITPFAIVIDEDFKLISRILGTNRNLIDSNGNTPLHAAISAKAKPEVMNMLVQKYIDDINQRNSQGLTALNYAIDQNMNDLAIILIKNGADPFIQDNKSECAVTLALRSENKEILEELVKYNKERTDTEQNTILHYAARTENADTLKALISWGLKKDAKNHDEETPSQVAKRWGNTAGVSVF